MGKRKVQMNGELCRGVCSEIFWWPGVGYEVLLWVLYLLRGVEIDAKLYHAKVKINNTQGL